MIGSYPVGTPIAHSSKAGWGYEAFFQSLTRVASGRCPLALGSSPKAAGLGGKNHASRRLEATHV